MKNEVPAELQFSGTGVTTLFLRTGRKPRSILELINITRLNGRRKI